MLFGLRDYETTVGHASLYFDAGGMFNIEVNAGKYLAGDWEPQQQYQEGLAAGGSRWICNSHRCSL